MYVDLLYSNAELQLKLERCELWVFHLDLTRDYVSVTEVLALIMITSGLSGDRHDYVSALECRLPFLYSTVKLIC